MFTTISKKPSKQLLDDENHHAYQKAYNRLDELCRLIGPALNGAGVKTSKLCENYTRRMITEHQKRQATLSKMLKNDAITADEFELLLKWHGVKDNPAFTKYPYVVKPFARRHSA